MLALKWERTLTSQCELVSYQWNGNILEWFAVPLLSEN